MKQNIPNPDLAERNWQFSWTWNNVVYSGMWYWSTSTGLDTPSPTLNQLTNYKHQKYSVLKPLLISWLAACNNLSWEFIIKVTSMSRKLFWPFKASLGKHDTCPIFSKGSQKRSDSRSPWSLLRPCLFASLGRNRWDAESLACKLPTWPSRSSHWTSKALVAGPWFQKGVCMRPCI